MPVLRRLLALALLLGAGAPLWAQGSPYVPLDHPLLPLAELLISRGDIADPSPMIRPFRRADLIRVLNAAALDTSASAGRIGERLRQAFTDSDSSAWFRVAARGGLQMFTRARRDLLHPAGADGVRFYADAAFEGRAGPLVLVSRPAAENRLKVDPDWAGAGLQRQKNQAYRFIDAYIAAQFRQARLFYGQMDRNWGPAQALGLSIANYGYPRSDVGFDLALRDLQFTVVATQLTDVRAADSLDHKRYFLAHRLNLRVSSRLNLALWETGLLAGPNQSFNPLFRNPMTLLSFPIQQGQADDRNTIIGGDLSWRPARRLLLEGQAMIDDKWRLRDDPGHTGELRHPGRYAFTIRGSGAIGATGSWSASLALLSSLAYRTTDSAKSFIDRGVGIGPHFPDNLVMSIAMAQPVARRWVVTPDLTLLRQGEGRIDAPFPVDRELSDTPELFIGTVASTYRIGTSVSGSAGGFALSGNAGLHHTTNADHVRGRSRTRLEARLVATFGWSIGGPLR